MFALLACHRVFAVYILSLLWLATAAFIHSRLTAFSAVHVFHILGVAAGTIAVYYGALKLLERVRPSWTADLPLPPVVTIAPRLRMLLTLMVGLYGIVVFSHFLMLGHVPVLEALTSDSDLGVSVVRQKGYLVLPNFMRYASDYSVKAIGPALMLLTYYFRSRLFWAVLVIGAIYCVGLFVRILPIILFMPLLVHLFMQRRWLHVVVAIATVAVLVGALTILSSITLRESAMSATENSLNVLSGVVKMSPSRDLRGEVSPSRDLRGEVSPSRDLRGEVSPSRDLRGEEGDWRRTSAIYALYDRALLVPGQVIYQWFEYYDEPDRRENGCGYRLLAEHIGCRYVPVPNKLYAAFYHENYENGLRGSLNAASFMTEFANFGPRGFLLSALLAGCLFAAVRVIYRNHPLALPMNLPLIVAAMESSILTAINSGSGWLVMTAIFLLFFRDCKE